MFYIISTTLRLFVFYSLFGKVEDMRYSYNRSYVNEKRDKGFFNCKEAFRTIRKLTQISIPHQMVNQYYDTAWV